MKRFLFLAVLCVTGLAVAMPTAKELEKVQKEIGELTAGMETARVIEIFEKAETEASRYLLLRQIAKLHVQEKKFDAAAADLMALYTLFPDIAPSVVVDEIQQIARGVNEKDAPGLLRLLRQSQALNRELKSKKPNRLVLAELRASVGQWKTASELLAEQGGAFAKVLENEAAAVDLPATADFWWDYEPTVKVAGDAFKSHAAQLYQHCLEDNLVKNPLKVELFRKRIGQMEPTEGWVLALTSKGKTLGGVQLWENGPYWAECNVGATKPEEYGSYFWWGDTVGYIRVGKGWDAVDGSCKGFKFKEENCPTSNKDLLQLRSAGYIDSAGNLVTTHDAATKYLGSPWRMPTAEEIQGLVGNCSFDWTTRHGVRGHLVKGKGAFASRSIFLPAAGYGYGANLYATGLYGLYWSSTPTSGCSNTAWRLYFDNSGNSRRGNYANRHGSFSVRPLRGFAK